MKRLLLPVAAAAALLAPAPALAAGTLPAERWESYRKLQREMEAIEARRNHLLRQERVREYKIRARANRPKKKR